MKTESPDSQMIALLDRVALADESALRELYELTSSKLYGMAVGHPDVKFGIARGAEFFALRGADPHLAAVQLVLAGTAHALHDFRCPGVERQGGRQDHANRFFAAVCKGNAVAHAFAVKVDIGLRCDADVVDFFGGHGRVG